MLRFLAATAPLLIASIAHAQPGAVVPPARLAILQAEERRAATPGDLLTLRNGIRSRDPLTAVLAIRAVGRLERPALAADLVPALRMPLPEIRAEAANAIGQAAQGWSAAARAAPPLSLDAIAATLIERLRDDDQPSVRAAVAETLGRLPYQTAEQVGRAEAALGAAAADTVADRLGIAKGLEALVRRQRARQPPAAATIETLRRFALVDADDPGSEADRLRDARIRRLALEALIAADALDDTLIVAASADPDPQVRRLAMRAAAISGRGTGVLARGLDDAAPMVRLEALRGFAGRDDDGACATFAAAAAEAEPRVALVAIDQMAVCDDHPGAVQRLEQAAADEAAAGPGRGWHRAAHALVALAAAAPASAAGALPRFVSSARWELRAYAARAAAILNDRDTLRTLAADAHDNVVEAAIEGLSAVAGHDEDAVFIQALMRSGYQAIRAAALALDGTPRADDAAAALKAAWTRLADENRANSVDTRAAIAAALRQIGAAVPAHKAETRTAPSLLSAAELRRLAAPRARITVRDVGVFEIALFTSEAPLTVLRFAALAESGYYDGLTFHRVAPNFVVQGGSPGASEYIGLADHLRDEVGLWPHVRGAVGLSTRGRDTGDAQFFVNLVDNPRFDHDYTVFAQVLNGIDVVDRILEGDVISRVEILP